MKNYLRNSEILNTLISKKPSVNERSVRCCSTERFH